MTIRRFDPIIWILIGVAVFVFGVVGIAVVHGEPMTHDQVIAEVQSKGIDWAASWIADVYLAVPVVTMPPLQSFVTDRDVAITVTAPVKVSISDKLAYQLTMGPWKFMGVVPHVDPWKLVEAGGIGFGVGVLATIVVEAVTGHLK
jgi:hypothetical protein